MPAIDTGRYTTRGGYMAVVQEMNPETFAYGYVLINGERSEEIWDNETGRLVGLPGEHIHDLVERVDDDVQ